MSRRPAFYARTGSTLGDLTAILHLPYTVWHLSYVLIGAGLAAEVDGLRLAGTLAAFALGLGVGAHALDEAHDRPLGTGFSTPVLWGLGAGAFGGAAAVAIVGAFVISGWVLAWAAVGILLAAGYALEWSATLHSEWGFAVAWGAFPMLAGYWAQAENLSIAAALAAAAATLLSLAQRRLSTPARLIRRTTTMATLRFDEDRSWRSEQLLTTWERPLIALALAMPLLGLAVLLRSR